MLRNLGKVPEMQMHNYMWEYYISFGLQSVQGCVIFDFHALLPADGQSFF